MNSSAERPDIGALSEMVLRLKAAADDDLSTVLLLICAAVQPEQTDLVRALSGGFANLAVRASDLPSLAACSGLALTEIRDRLRDLADRGLMARLGDRVQPTAMGLAYLDRLSRDMDNR